MTKKRLTVEQLKKVDLKKCKKYIVDFDSMKNQTVVEIQRPLGFSKTDFDIIKNIDNPIIKQYVEIAKNPVDESDKMSVILQLKKLLSDNPVMIAKIKDNNKKSQIAIVKIFQQSDKISDTDFNIKITDSDKWYNCNVYVNNNLDESFGTESENPRIKISSILNGFINYQFFASCDNVGLLMNQNILWIQDLIEKQQGFDGIDIVNRGTYDSDDMKTNKKSDKSDDSDDSDDSNDFVDLWQ